MRPHGALAAASPDAQAPAPLADATVRRRWPLRVLTEPFSARTWRELAYVVTGSVLGHVGALYVLVSLSLAGLLSPLLVGIPLVGVAVLGARALGAAHRALVEALLDEPAPGPAPFRPRPGLLGFVVSSLGDVAGWRAMAFLAIRSPLAAAAGYGVAMVTAMGAVLTAYPVWWSLARPENTDLRGRVRDSGMQVGEWYADTWPRAMVLCAAGVAVLLAVPWVVRALVVLDRWLVRALLGPTARDAELERLESTRVRAVVTADERLRRIERDLHDGAQARMAAVAMSLGQLQDDLDDDDAGLDPTKVRRLVDAAHANAMTSIRELRDLARGIHPPVLDVGLEAALADLAATSPLPVEVRVGPGSTGPPDVESVLYFCAAELMANVARHSGAGGALIELARVDGDLHLRVIDDGRGGVDPRRGSGLSGLAERLAPVDGHLDVSSPPGGPTRATVTVPLRSGGSGG